MLQYTIFLAILACAYVSQKWFRDSRYESGWDQVFTVCGALGYAVATIKLTIWLWRGMPCSG